MSLTEDKMRATRAPALRGDQRDALRRAGPRGAFVREMGLLDLLDQRLVDRLNLSHVEAQGLHEQVDLAAASPRERAKAKVKATGRSGWRTS